MQVKDIPLVLEKIVKRVNEHARRIRMLEERNRVSEMKTSTLEETILKLGEITREDMEKIAEKIAEAVTEAWDGKPKARKPRRDITDIMVR